MALPSLSSLGIGGSGGNALGTLYVRLAADSSLLIKGMADGDKAVKYASAAIIGALGAIAVAAVREFAKFDKAMTEAFSIMGKQTEEVKKQMSDLARDVAKNSVKSAEDMGKSFYFLASAGLNAQQSMKALPLVTKFATAGMFDLGRATSLLVDAQTALGLRSEDASENLVNMTRVADAISKANIQTTSSVAQLSEALTNKFAAALRITNKDVEEGLAILGAFAMQGVKGAEAGEKANIVLRDLQRVAIENREVFADLGVAVFDSSGEVRHMADVLIDLENTFKDAAPETRRMALELMGFQDKSMASLLQLVGFSGAVRQFDTDIRKAGGTLNEVTDTMLSSFSSQVTITVNRLKDLLITIGEELRPALDFFNKQLQEATTLNTAANISFKENVRIIGGAMVKAFEGLKFILGGVMMAFKAVAIAGLYAAEHVVGQWLTAFDLLTIAYQAFTGVVAKGVNFLIDTINSLVAALPTNIQDRLGLGEISNILREDIGKIPFDREKLEDWITTLQLARKEIEEGLVSSVVGAAQAIEPAVEVINVAFENLEVKIGEKIQGITNQVSRLQKAMASRSVNSELDAIGLPEKRYMGNDPFMGEAFANQAEIDKAASALAVLEEMGNEEVRLTEAVQQRKLEAIAAYNEKLKQLQTQQTQVILSASQNAFDEMTTAAKAWAGEQSDIYKTMFAMSKAFAIAEAIVKIQQGIASAASLPWPANLAAMASVVAATASIVSTIASVKLTLEGKKAVGGGVRSGGNYLVGERGPEMFSPASNGNIVPNHRLGGDVKVIINNYSDARAEVTERNDGEQRIYEVVIRKLKSEMGAEIRDGRGDISRAMEQSYGLRRGKS